MEKSDNIPHEVEKESEPAAPAVPWRAPYNPPPIEAPLTPEEIEAGLELCRMIGIDPNSLSEERLKELRKTWE